MDFSRAFPAASLIAYPGTEIAAWGVFSPGIQSPSIYLGYSTIYREFPAARAFRVSQEIRALETLQCTVPQCVRQDGLHLWALKDMQTFGSMSANKVMWSNPRLYENCAAELPDVVSILRTGIDDGDPALRHTCSGGVSGVSARRGEGRGARYTTAGFRA